MPTHRSHQWYLEVDEKAREEIRELPANVRRTVFEGIRELLIEDNPTLASNTRKLVEKRFEGLWRKRQGDYRIFFAIDAQRIVVDKFSYRGKVIVVEVLNRKDAY